MSKPPIERTASPVITKTSVKRLIWLNSCLSSDVKCVFLAMEGFCGTKNPIRIARTPMISKIQPNATPQLQPSGDCVFLAREGAHSQQGSC